MEGRVAFWPAYLARQDYRQIDVSCFFARGFNNVQAQLPWAGPESLSVFNSPADEHPEQRRRGNGTECGHDTSKISKRAEEDLKGSTDSLLPRHVVEGVR